VSLLGNLRIYEERIAPGWRRNHVQETALGDNNCVLVPEIDRGQVARENLLRLDIVGAPAAGVRARGGIGEQSIEPRIRIVTAVGAFRRKVRGRKYVAENVRLLIAADPAERVHLEGAACDIRIESGELVAAQIQSNADSGKLLLQHGSQKSGSLVGAGFHREMETNAVRASRVTGFIEQPVRADRIVIVLVYLAGKGPMLRRQQAHG
jgi:hypothetical protein